MTIQARLATAKAAHAASGQRDAHSRAGSESRSARIDTVPLAAHRRDCIGPEPGAQPPDVNVNHVGCGIWRAGPDAGEQVALGHDRAGQAHELPHRSWNSRLASGTGPPPVSACRRSTSSVSRPHARTGGPGHAAGAACLYPRHKLADVERLGHVVVSSETQTGHLRLRITEAGQHEDGLIGPAPHDVPQRAEPVLARHEQVEDHQIVRPGRGHRNGVGAPGGSVRLDAVVAQYPDQDLADPLLVVDDQHAAARGSRVRGMRIGHRGFRQDHAGRIGRHPRCASRRAHGGSVAGVRCMLHLASAAAARQAPRPIRYVTVLSDLTILYFARR